MRHLGGIPHLSNARGWEIGIITHLLRNRNIYCIIASFGAAPGTPILVVFRDIQFTNIGGSFSYIKFLINTSI